MKVSWIFLRNEIRNRRHCLLFSKFCFAKFWKENSLTEFSMLSPGLGESGGLAPFWQPTLSSLLPVTAESINMMASHTRRAQPGAANPGWSREPSLPLRPIWNDLYVLPSICMKLVQERNHITYSRLWTFLEQKPGTSVGDFIHYNVSTQ